jgi:AcrR family transcriptional regulator
VSPGSISACILPKYRPIPVDEKAEQTRQAIISAATDAFKVHGYAATTMGAVAALAGVSPRTLYRHYGSKGELFAATIAVGMGDFLDQFRAYVQRWPLRKSILMAFTHAAVDASEESRALLYLITIDEEASQVALSTAQRMLPPMSAVLRTVAGAEAEADTLAWEVRAAALLDAMSLGYRHWAATPGSDLLAVVTDAVDTVLPILQPSNAHSDAQLPTPDSATDAC